jgi:branched-chain amino acid transport system substrate-binding protein
MKRGAFATGAAVGLIGLIAATASLAGGARTQAGKPIVLGAVIALSGLAAPFDAPPTLGAELAIKDINARGGVLGRPLEMIKVDFKSDRKLGGTAALEALDKGAEIIVSSCDFDFGAPSAQQAAKKGVVAFSLCASSPLFGPAGISPLAFTAGTAGNVQASVAAEWAYSKKKWKTAYLLKDKSISFTSEWVDYFKQRWTELAGAKSIIGQETFLNNDPSFASEVTRLKGVQDKVDVIAACTYPPGGATLVREIRAAGIKLPIVSCLAMGGTYWLKAVPNLSDLYTIEAGTSYPTAKDSNQKVNALLRRYIQAAHSTPPGASYINGYSMVELIARAIKSAGSTNGEALRKALEKFSRVPTIAGPTSFDSKIHIRANPVPLAVMSIQNGKPVFVTRYQPQKVVPVKF